MGQEDAPLRPGTQPADDRVAVGADVGPFIGGRLGQRENLSPFRPRRDVRRTREDKLAPIAHEQQVGGRAAGGRARFAVRT